jgi:Family of unknown function (DUF6446)
MNGKWIVGFFVLTGVVTGIVLYWLQVYAYYDKVAFQPGAEITLVPVTGGAPQPIIVDNIEGIDGANSPLRFRACFTTPTSLATLTETYVIHPDAIPLTTPGWFACFDAKAIGAALESGQAVAFLSQPEIHRGIDRVVAVFGDGRAFAWHQANASLKD